MTNSLRVLAIALIVVLVAACQSLPPSTEPTVAAPAEESSALSPLAPSATEPAATESTQAGTEGRFQIDRPVRANDTIVTGTGLKGTAIALYDLTNMGIELGGGVIGDDGRFSIKVPPLTGNIRIGIQLVEQNDAIWADEAILGPGAMVVPLVGAFVDTVLVTP